MKILLIKAEGTDRTALEETLRGLPVDGGSPTVLCASTSSDALRLAAEEPFILAVADLVLPKPGLSGAETLIRLGELYPTTRTLLFSDHACAAELLSGTSDVFLPRGGGLETFRGELFRCAARMLAHDGLGSWALNRIDTVGDESTSTGLPAAAERPDLIAGKYRLIRELGRGGMGVVHLAEDTIIGRRVALKLLQLRGTRPRESLVKRMRREVQITGQLDHPNIVTVYEAGFEFDEMYFVMELIDGQDLHKRLAQDGALERDEAIAILLQVLDAVICAHRHRIVHRDLKPKNILLTPDGKVKVVDFGVAKMVSLASSSGDAAETPSRHETTTHGMIVGTKGYMAPEQLRGDFDHRSDLYALGVVLHEMLTAHPAGSGRPRAPRTIEIEGDPQLTQIICRARAILPDERFQSGEAFAKALRDVLKPSAWKRLFPWI